MSSNTNSSCIYDKKKETMFVCLFFHSKIQQGFPGPGSKLGYFSLCRNSLINIPTHGLRTFDEFIGSAYREETFAFLLVMSLLAWLIEKKICIGVRFVHKVMAQTLPNVCFPMNGHKS